VALEVRPEVARVVGQQHRVLVHVDQGQRVEEPLKAQHLAAIERNDHRRDTADLPGHLQLGWVHGHPAYF